MGARTDNPRPWRDGDPRVHCTHCNACHDLYPTADIARHREVCPVERARLTALDNLRRTQRGQPALPSVQFEILGGDYFPRTVEHMIALANRDGVRVCALQNGTITWAVPGDTAEIVAARWQSDREVYQVAKYGRIS